MAKTQNNKPIVKQPADKQPVTKERISKHWFSVRNLCIVLAFISFVLYANTLQNGYVLDDVMVLKDNALVTKGIKAIPEILATPRLKGFGNDPKDFYRPLSQVMFAIEVQFFGASPAAGHFFNILVFIGCVIMFFLFLDKLFERKKTAIAFIAALLFAIHPIHTEVVANIKSRDELLCYFFGFLSLNLFMNYMKQGKIGQLIMGISTLFLAYISKETVITFLAIIPVLFFLYDKVDVRRGLLITGSAVAVTVVFLAIRTVVLNKYHANEANAVVDFMENALVQAPSVSARIATEFLILGKYLLLMIVPYPLLCNYSFNSIPYAGFGDVSTLLSIAVYGAMVVFSISRLIKNKKDPWAFAILFYLATLSLFSNFAFLVGAEMAERFMFFASTGFCIAVALAMERWIMKAEASNIMVLKSTKVLVVLVPVFLIFSGMTIARNGDWKDNYTLYKTDLEKSPNDCRLYFYLGTAISQDMYEEEKDTTKRHEMDLESVKYIRQALQIYPDFAEAHAELGRIDDRMKLYDSAVYHDLWALKIKPYNSNTNNNLGKVYHTMGNYPLAIASIKKAIALNPDFKVANLNLALTYSDSKQYDSSIVYFHKVLTLDPQNYDAEKGIAMAYFMLQNMDSAEFHFKQVVNLKPSGAEGINNLGTFYLRLKKYPQAIELFKKVISVDPNYILGYANLGSLILIRNNTPKPLRFLKKELIINPKNSADIPYIALSYQKTGKMDSARKYEAIAKQFYSNFKLE